MHDDLVIDCFAGGGGASLGIEMALGRAVDIAVNHDPEAIRMHLVKHPGTILDSRKYKIVPFNSEREKL